MFDLLNSEISRPISSPSQSACRLVSVGSPSMRSRPRISTVPKTVERRDSVESAEWRGPMSLALPLPSTYFSPQQPRRSSLSCPPFTPMLALPTNKAVYRLPWPGWRLLLSSLPWKAPVTTVAKPGLLCFCSSAVLVGPSSVSTNRDKGYRHLLFRQLLAAVREQKWKKNVHTRCDFT